MTRLNPTPWLILAFLAVLTVASRIHEYIAYSFFPFRHHPSSPAGTIIDTVVPVACTLIGQLVIGYVADRYGRRAAMKLVVAGFLLPATVMFIGFLAAGRKSDVVRFCLVFGPILGGSESTVSFLALVLLHDEVKDFRQRSAFFYATGAVMLGFGVLATLTVANLFWHLPSGAVPGASIVCGVVGGVIAWRIGLGGDGEAEVEEGLLGGDASAREATENDPLIPRTRPAGDDDAGRLEINESSEIGFLGGYKKCVSEGGSETWTVLGLFLLLGIPQVMAPLAWNYALTWHIIDLVRHSRALLFWAPIISAAIVCITLPLLVWKGPWSERRLTLHVSQAGAVLFAVGALLIGFSRPLAVLVLGMVITALGSATSLSILAFYVAHVDRALTGRTIMLVSAFGSVGQLLGIAGLYPAYMWGIKQPSLAGGLPFYICSGIYAAAAGVLFSRFKLSSNTVTLA
ncbi:hypothetical protein QBC42DRAFT_276349 [Cladorrhinum samala]|uniref:Major facilitator superfamily (MFS) profile domain-containing protein n=1 Tax=Cladorrhinum samala TaxID=585594 RepID=A0AAV9HFS3_9PEZI|nr:hypothetical protein QBC42DRAFT_276349 [Cladorrhinum samala]